MPKGKKKPKSSVETGRPLVEVGLLVACTCSDGPRLEDGSIVPHLHPQMIKADETAIKWTQGGKKEKSAKQLPFGANGWDPEEYLEAMG